MGNTVLAAKMDLQKGQNQRKDKPPEGSLLLYTRLLVSVLSLLCVVSLLWANRDTLRIFSQF